MGKLTTHVLDTAHGCPAANLTIELWVLNGEGDRRLIATTITNADGRTDAPMLADADLVPGVYELVFCVGGYFSQFAESLPEPPFLNRVPLQFGIADATAHYHVALLASPWSYSTYRGS
ncbi:MAG: hydroxyisourate hydrolase [Kaiparowitsia implicata GSE-PSE-MK54-09C]|jgi:5-hydroxyisourate hydrolase|nr:hydroxyisourate hydrolase [Kaiparowitsia implicata GSE-PSE-MK54-09C]